MNIRVACVVIAAAALRFGLCYAQEKVHCQTYVGNYRDCTCGVQYRDLEERCCSKIECELPNAWTENFTCPFTCQNGGVFDSTYNHCSCPIGYSGLCCEKETPFCGGMLFQNSGRIIIPSTLANGTRCVWRILTDRYRNIALGTLYSVRTPEWGPNNCNTENTTMPLKVYDGKNTSAPQLVSSMYNDFHTVYSSGRVMYIEYVAQNATNLQFFILSYVTFFEGQNCGPQSSYKLSGTITSPQYPLDYRPNEDCSWNIYVQPGYALIITIVAMDVMSSPGCQEGDRLALSIPTRQLATFCGNGTLAPYSVENVSVVTLRFTSDQCGEGNGFELRYDQFKQN